MGTEIRVGDEVTVRCTVRFAGDACELGLETMRLPGTRNQTGPGRVVSFVAGRDQIATHTPAPVLLQPGDIVKCRHLPGERRVLAVHGEMLWIIAEHETCGHLEPRCEITFVRRPADV